MRPHPSTHPPVPPAARPARLVAGLLAVLSSVLTSGLTPAVAADDAQARYRAERQACLSGHTGQDRATCLKEAGAALADARRQRLDTGESDAQLRANALQRCQRQRAEDRPACERMARGEGSASGSVADGGVLRELTVRSAAAAPAAAASR